MNRTDDRDDDLSSWPGVLRELAEIAGVEVALCIAETHGGLSATWIPSRLDKAHPWRELLTTDAQWAAIVARWGGQRIYLPRGTRRGAPIKVAILERLEAGQHVVDIARDLRTTERYVRRLAAMIGTSPRLAQRRDPRQKTLFEE